MTVSECPIRAEIQLYAVGKLDNERSEEIDAHLDQCATCQALLGTVGTGDDTFLDSLKQPAEVDEYASEQECQEALALMQAFGREPSFVAAGVAEIAESETSNLGIIRDYQLLAKLGEGGMGAVYKTLHRRLNKVFALKLLPREQTTNDHAVARFKREMLAVGALEHPNIVRATDAGEHEGVHFLVMEYVKGQDLSRLSKRCGPLPIAVACELVRRAAVGLQHAHEHGLIHRDVKPSNLMLSSSGEVKILDLGLALLQEQYPNLSGELTNTGQLMGTIDYMAPEQGNDSHEVDGRADVYSLGATLYRLLCGEAPFSDAKYNKPVRKLMAVANEPAPLLSDRRPDVPAELAGLVRRMLEKDPDKRPATPGEVAALLEPFAAGSDLTQLLVPDKDDFDVHQGDATRSKSTSSHCSSAMQDTTRWQLEPEAALRPVDENSTATAAFRTFPLRRSRGAAVALAVGLAAAVLAAVLITIRNKDGIVEVELAEGVDAKSVQVEVLQGGETIRVADTTQGWNIELADGDYRLQLGDGKDRFELSQDTVVVRRGDTVRVTVTRKQNARGGRSEPAIGTAPKRDAAPDSPVARSRPAARPNPFAGPPPRVTVEPNAPMSPDALVSHPATIKGLKSWTLESWRHRGELRRVRFSPDGRLVAASGEDQVVRLWDAKTFQLVRILPSAWAQTWSPDGKYLATAGPENTVRIWDVERGRIIRVLSDHRLPVRDIAWSPDGEYLASTGSDDSAARLWNVRTGTLVRTLDGIGSTEVSAVAFSPDGKTLAIGTDGIRLFQLAADNLHDIPSAHSRFRSVKWSPSDSIISAGLWQYNGMGLWDAQTGKQIGETVSKGLAYADHAWSPDGANLVVAYWNDSKLDLIDPTTARIVQTWQIPELALGSKGRAVDWSPDGRTIVVGTNRGAIQFWDVERGELRNEIIGHCHHGGIALSPNQKALVVGGSHGISLARIFDTHTGTVSESSDASIGPDLLLSPDGNFLAFGGYGVYLWQLSSAPDEMKGRCILDDIGVPLAWSPDSKCIVVQIDEEHCDVI